MLTSPPKVTIQPLTKHTDWVYVGCDETLGKHAVAPY